MAGNSLKTTTRPTNAHAQQRHETPEPTPQFYDFKRAHTYTCLLLMMNGLLLLNVKKTVFLTRFCQRAAAEAAAGRLALGIGYRDSSGLTIDECSLAYGVMDESASRVSASSCPPFRFTFRYRVVPF